MGKCLVTRLSESINDDNLLKLGELRFETNGLYSGEGDQLMISSVEDQSISVVGEGEINDYYSNPLNVTFPGGKSITIYNGQNNRGVGVSPTVAPCQLSIPNKYALQRFFDGPNIAAPIDLASFAYSPNIYQLLCNNLYGDLSSLARLTILEELRIGPNTTGKLSDLPNKNMRVIYLSESAVEGNISELSEFTSLTTLRVNRTQVGGTLESFLEGQFNNGRTSGSVDVLFTGSEVTFNGNKNTSTHVCEFSSTGCTVKRLNVVIGTVVNGIWTYA